MNSTPSVCQFDPTIIPFQQQVISDIRKNFDYSLGTHELMLSGAVGSAKSLLMAHMAITHCMHFPGARFMLGRRAMPDLRATIFSKILEHMHPDLEEGNHYYINHTTATIKFRNKSEIISRSWADRHYFKLRSLELSGAAIEETTENEELDFYDEVKMRVGRLSHVPENFIIHATNPGSPSSPWYEYFFETKSPLRHVYLSTTADNPFLPKAYVEGLRREMCPKLARRMLHGEWIEIAQDVVYYAYDKSKNFIDKPYVIDHHYPIRISWDFNISHDKPMSVVLFQFINGTMHIFAEVIIEGMRTQDSCEELADRGFLDHGVEYIIHGDASGKNRDTRNIRSDYDIIKKYMANRSGLKFRVDVPLANPPIRRRHNICNAHICNDLGERRLFVYQGCNIVDKGLRLTALRPGGSYCEDDSKPWQHCTTAIGYGLIAALKELARKPQATIIL